LVIEIAPVATAFCFLLLYRHLQFLLGQVFRPDPGRSPSDLFPIVGHTIARRATEVLKADGKRLMTAGDGL
jgi:hypothetical protein